MLLQMVSLLPQEKKEQRSAADFISRALELCFPTEGTSSLGSVQEYVVFLYLLKQYHSLQPRKKADRDTKILLSKLGDIYIPEGMLLFRHKHIASINSDFIASDGHWETLKTIDCPMFRKLLTYKSHQEVLVNKLIDIGMLEQLGSDIEEPVVASQEKQSVSGKKKRRRGQNEDDLEALSVLIEPITKKSKHVEASDEVADEAPIKKKNK